MELTLDWKWFISTLALIHHVFLPMAPWVWCMSFYKIVLSQMILWMASTTFSKYVGTLLEVMFHFQYYVCFLHLDWKH
jgi:hypothetical protein